MVRHRTKVLRSPCEEISPANAHKYRAIAQEAPSAGVIDQDRVVLLAAASSKNNGNGSRESTAVMADWIRSFLQVIFRTTITYVEHRRSLSTTVRDLVAALEFVARQQQRPAASYLTNDDSDNEKGKGDEDGRKKSEESRGEKHDTEEAPKQEHEEADNDAGGDDVMDNGDDKPDTDTTKVEDETILVSPPFFCFFPPLDSADRSSPNGNGVRIGCKALEAMWTEMGQESRCDLRVEKKKKFFELLGKALDAYVGAMAVQYWRRHHLFRCGLGCHQT
mmetsp:Transcript_106333/g.296068  ORF Transcript_106333/g.296068 Transcript_106333/m.296068 type:complete len:277 (-) Transcript_106333:1346-2176(-)